MIILVWISSTKIIHTVTKVICGSTYNKKEVSIYTYPSYEIFLKSIDNTI